MNPIRPTSTNTNTLRQSSGRASTIPARSHHAPRPRAGASFPPLDVQLGRQSILEGEGMIFCPQRRSQIAIMRCGEYQEAFGCGESCPARASRAQIAEIRSRIFVDDGDGGQRLNAGRGRDKRARLKTFQAETCPKCGRHKSYESKQCVICMRAEQKAGIRKKKFDRCAVCRRKKTLSYGERCRSCAAAERPLRTRRLARRGSWT